METAKQQYRKVIEAQWPTLNIEEQRLSFEASIIKSNEDMAIIFEKTEDTGSYVSRETQAAFNGWLLAKESCIADKGPWQVDKWSDNRVVLQSHTGEHDVALIINGDFGSQESKLEYANKLCIQINNVQNNK